MTNRQTQRFKALCKACGINADLSYVNYFQLCHTVLVRRLHVLAKREKLHDGYYWLIDAWILRYNRVSGTTQYADAEDLKVGMAKSNQHPVDFLFDRLSEIKKYRKKGLFTDKKYNYA